MRTWPADWESRKAGADCPMCAEGRPAETPFGIRFFEGEVSSGHLRRGHSQRGYAFVLWRGRHVSEVTELSAVEAATYWDELLAVARALETYYVPAKLNILILGNETPHLHAHIVPRYVDDRAPGRPLLEADADRPPAADDDVRRDARALERLLADAEPG